MIKSVFDIEAFIKTHIIHRQQSLLQQDLEDYRQTMQERINDKSVLVIGGAGTIRSSFIKAILKFKPSRLYVCI